MTDDFLFSAGAAAAQAIAARRPARTGGSRGPPRRRRKGRTSPRAERVRRPQGPRAHPLRRLGEQGHRVGFLRCHSGARQRVRAKRGPMTGSARTRNPEQRPELDSGLRASHASRNDEWLLPVIGQNLGAGLAQPRAVLLQAHQNDLVALVHMRAAKPRHIPRAARILPSALRRSCGGNEKEGNCEQKSGHRECPHANQRNDQNWCRKRDSNPRPRHYE